MLKNILGGWQQNQEDAEVSSLTMAPSAIPIDHRGRPIVRSNLTVQQQQQQQYQGSTQTAAGRPPSSSASFGGSSKAIYAPPVVAVAAARAAALPEETDDQIADRLLVQFPAYGSRQSSHPTPLNPAADWLLGGTGGIPSQQQLLKKQLQQQKENMQQHQGGGSSSEPPEPLDTPNNATHKNSNKEQQAPAFDFKDWDKEEQDLWKGEHAATPANPTARSRVGASTTTTATSTEQQPPSHSTGAADTNSNNATYDGTMMNLRARYPKGEVAGGFPEDWLMAYYYHTGVQPPPPQESQWNHHHDDHTAERSSGRPSSSAFAITPASLATTTAHYSSEDFKDGSTLFQEADDRSHHTATTATSVTRGGTSKGSSSSPADPSSNDKEHWMPDVLCKHCYACDSPFTVFRRRHHCRICGQVFCNACSGYFVPGNSAQDSVSLVGGPGGESSSSLFQDDGRPMKTATIIRSSILLSASLRSTTAMSQTNKTILRTCKMCYDQVTAATEAAAAESKFDNTTAFAGLPLSESQQQQHHRQNTNSQKHETGLSSPPPTPVHHRNKADSDRSGQVLLQEQMDKGQSTVLKEMLLSQQQQASIEKEEDTRSLQQNTNNAIPLRQQSHSSGTTSRRPPSHPDRAPHASMRPANQRTLSSNSLVSHNDPSTSSVANRVEEGEQHLGLTAAAHLEQLGAKLLETDAPLLWKSLDDVQRRLWKHKLMGLATRCCATVEPNIKRGDMLDIRPYVKLKVIPGGSYQDCAYMSGILFRKTVSHKKMAKEIINPRIMLLSGGIEFTRTENRIASLETLMEQEGKYMEILVGRILKLKPDVLLVGRSVSRHAQELLLKARVALVQHVKTSLMKRISRQTGATVISSTDHIMNQFGAHVLGNCYRFRIVVARDNETWTDSFSDDNKDNNLREISSLLQDDSLKNHERQAVLAANMLGESIMDGPEAVKSGLAKRGVAQTFVLLEGCPKHLGCTVILRGANRAALKQVKLVFRFLVNVAYNLRLERSYLSDRGATVHPDFKESPGNLFSSSICVDYNAPLNGKKVRPWNGGNNNEGTQRSISGQITAFDHQSILISSVWMAGKTQCCPAEVKGICYYSMQDVSLGQFLRDSCFNLSLKCQNPSCKKSLFDHSLSFVHNDGLINITVDHMENPLPPANSSKHKEGAAGKDDTETDEVEDPPIATWTYCRKCSRYVTPVVYISEQTWKYSFGKFLESFFYNHDLVTNSSQSNCTCQLQSCGTLYFGCGRLAASFKYERIRPYGVFVRKHLPIDMDFHRSDALRQLELVSMSSSTLFSNFDKHIEKVSRDARSLIGNVPGRPDYLQTVLVELSRIGSEVDHASKTLQDKIASVSEKCAKDGELSVTDGVLRFPWFARRYLFMLTSAWNEKLTAAGQAIVGMKRLAAAAGQRVDGVMGQNVTGIGGDGNDELHEGIRRLRQLHEVYSRYNIIDFSTVLPSIPGSTPAEIEYDDDFEDPDGGIDFVAGDVDADVLASRRRLHNASLPPSDQSRTLTKSLGTRHEQKGYTRLSPETIPNATVSTKVTPGGAVKSAITRFFTNRGGRESDPFVVDLGMFNEGRPRLEPGVNGIVIPIVDDQLCTVIAYSLSSTEYSSQFQTYLKYETDPPRTKGNESVAGSSDGRIPIDSTQAGPNPPSSASARPGGANLTEKQGIERRMLMRHKSHIKHTFRDFDEKGQSVCKFTCTTYWATQFHAVRQAFLSKHIPKGANAGATSPVHDIEQAFVKSLSAGFSWAASGGKSGASFARSSDNRFVIKCISKTELQMFLDCAPAYFEYLSKAFFHGLPTVLCKIFGVYQILIHNRETGKKTMEQVAVMQNIFYNKSITKTFDLKGSLRGRFATRKGNDEVHFEAPSSASDTMGNRKRPSDSGTDADGESEYGSEKEEQTIRIKSNSGTLLDGDFLEFTAGRPMPMHDRAKAVVHMSILNDTLFLSIINVIDYSILVGIDEEKMELVVGIIDFMRQYDILKQMERVGKSLPMVVGSEAPTIIQPPLYKARFTSAMDRYFMTVPSKWTTI